MYLREDEKDLTMQWFKPWSMDLDNYLEENEPAREIDIVTFPDEGIEYMIPDGKADTVSAFGKLLVGGGEQLFDIDGGRRTLYEDDPATAGNSSCRFRMWMAVPEGEFDTGGDDDAVFAIYQKGTARPLVCRYPVRKGILGIMGLLEYHDYGEYFVLIANMHPVERLRKHFTRMGNCWRYDFVFLPNGIAMSHPDIRAELSREHRLQLTFGDTFRPELSRFMVQCYDADYKLIGLNDDLKLMKNSRKVSIRPSGTFIWPDECCHVVLLHNLVPFVYIRIGTEDGKPVSTYVEMIGISDRFYWLATEVGCDSAITRRWNAIRGNRPAKETVLDFIAESTEYEYNLIAVPLSGPDMDALVCFAKIIYPEEQLECYDVAERMASGETAIKCLSDEKDETFPPVRVLCVTNIHLFETPEGEACLAAVRAFAEMENRAVIYQDITYEPYRD